jgi:hypothetical protein
MTDRYLPKGSVLLPGESVYSWCASVFRASACMHSMRVAEELLGRQHAARQHDMPASLARLPILAEGDSAGLAKLIREHTVGGYYWPFHDKETQARIVSMAQQGSDRWRIVLCSKPRDRTAHHPLKLCQACVASDLKTHGRAYWHVEHQCPTSVVCVHHGAALHLARGGSKTWRLPDEGGADASLPIHVPSDDSPAVLAALGAEILRVETIDEVALREHLIMRLREAGLASLNVTRDRARIAAWFASTAVGRMCVAVGQGLERFADGEWIAPLLWRRKLNYPVCWVLLWAALPWESSQACTREFSLVARGLTLSGRQVELFGGRDAALTPPSDLLNTLEGCRTYDEALQRLQAPRSSLFLWLDTNPELRAVLKASIYDTFKRRCVGRLTDAVKADPAVRRSTLAKTYGADIRWLGKHSPEVLDQILRAVPARGAAQRTLFA